MSVCNVVGSERPFPRERPALDALQSPQLVSAVSAPGNAASSAAVKRARNAPWAIIDCSAGGSEAWSRFGAKIDGDGFKAGPACAYNMRQADVVGASERVIDCVRV